MAFTVQELQAGFRIGACLIEPRQNRIVRGDVEVRLEPRVIDVLVCLAQHAGEVVSRDTLNDQVWGKVVVTDQAVTNCISELRQHLGDDRAAHRVIETIPKRGYRLTAPVHLVEVEPLQDRSPPAARAVEPVAPPSAKRWLVVAGLVLLGAVLLGFAWSWWSAAQAPTLTSVAVLRFENAAADATLDYLGLALPDEIATLLTQSRSLAVRPSEYVDADAPLATARARRVDHIVSGRYYLEDNHQLSLAIEAQQVSQERVIWRARITAPVGDLLAMRARIEQSVQQGLLPALGATAVASRSIPVNDEAYQLYLRSLALPRQPKPTERAIEMLERTVQLEPQYVPAWVALGLRYYDHGTYGPGAESARRQSLAAHRKAIELDPTSMDAARQIIVHLAEAGELAAAYEEAQRLLKRFGPRTETHFSLAYVERFGGLLTESQRHCELALQRDPHNPRLRSCAYSYLYAGKLERVMDFLMLDEGSYFSQWGSVLYHLRRDDRDSALHLARQAADDPTRRFMEPCLEGAKGAALAAPLAEFITHWQRNTDPEAAYAIAPMLVHCGYPQEALRFLARAVNRDFCAFPALDLDPMWAAVRNEPEFQRIRDEAMACHDRFRRMVAAHDQES